MRFEELLRKISPTLKRITYKLSSRHSFIDMDDLYQEALVHLWRDFCKGLLEDKTDSYILQGCYFYMKNYIRTHIKKKVFLSLQSEKYDEEGQVLEEFILCDNFNKSSYLDSLNDKLLAEVIRNNGLSPREKTILSFCCEGLTTRQIGERLGISHVRVVKLMALIRNKCRRYLDGP